jgi:putative ABC transport system substrate-binding protein
LTAERVDALVTANVAENSTYHRLIIELAAKARLPAMYTQPEAARNGGLMAYGPNIGDVFRRLAVYVDRVLRGAKAADLPIEQPTTFDFIVNLKTAKVLGLSIPKPVLLRATEVIDR